MATTIHGYLRAQRIDGLCSDCWLPSLLKVTMVLLLPDGVAERDRGTRCAHCGPRPNQ